MTKAEALKLIPEKSYVRFAKGKYRVAGITDMFGATMIEIYDEPPSLHVDTVKAESCESIKNKTIDTVRSNR